MTVGITNDVELFQHGAISQNIVVIYTVIYWLEDKVMSNLPSATDKL